VHQHFSLIPALTVGENLALAAGSGPAFYRRSADLIARPLALARRLGWQFDPDTPVWQLGIGHQQRLEIIKALQRDAPWLLFDEPTAVLSPPEVDELFTVLENLRREGRAIVFISHKLPEVLRLCDRVTVLRRGRRVAVVGRGVSANELARLMVGSAAPIAASEPGRMERAAYDVMTRPHAAERPPAQRPDSVALSVRDLRVRDDRGLEAVRGLTFEIQHGEIFGIAGVDGNGQAELAEAVMGLRAPVAGEICIAATQDEEGFTGSRAVSRRRSKLGRPGYIPQDRRHAGLVLPMSVRENLALEIHALQEFRSGPLLRHERLWTATRDMAARFDVRVDDLRLPAAALSGGNQQKIVIARALTGARSLLVAVNPTRSLDVASARYVHNQLRSARESGVGILMISTELDEVQDLSDRIGVLYAGRLLAIVLPGETRERIGRLMGGLSASG
jgi:general nucleoside transport system ATP-binding protein